MKFNKVSTYTTLFVLIFSIFISPMVSNAEEKPQPTLAIIDRAINSQIPEFKGKVVYEVCILDWPSCPNGRNFMEGINSAGLPQKLLTKNGNDHGIQMAYAAFKTNPNLQIVFVRYQGTTSDGTPQVVNESSFVNAFKWILDNRTKFNIQAVAMSQGTSNWAPNQIDYCPKTTNMPNILKQFETLGIPVFLAAGNERNKTKVNWPSCYPEAVTISATDAGDSLALYSNFDPNRTDFFARGDMRVLTGDGTMKNAAGTSISTQVAAAIWMFVKSRNPDLKNSQIMNLLNEKGEQISMDKTWKYFQIKTLNTYNFIK